MIDIMISRIRTEDQFLESLHWNKGSQVLGCFICEQAGTMGGGILKAWLIPEFCPQSAYFWPFETIKILKNPHKLDKSAKPGLQDCTTCATLSLKYQFKYTSWATQLCTTLKSQSRPSWFYQILMIGLQCREVNLTRLTLRYFPHNTFALEVHYWQKGRWSRPRNTRLLSHAATHPNTPPPFPNPPFYSPKHPTPNKKWGVSSPKYPTPI